VADIWSGRADHAAGGLATLHEQALIVWILTLVPMLACFIAGCMLITVVARRTMTATIAALIPPVFFRRSSHLLTSLNIAQGQEMLVIVLAAVILLLGFRVLGRRESLVTATLLAVSIHYFVSKSPTLWQGGPKTN